LLRLTCEGIYNAL